jgi:hypothetical protein
MDKGQVKVIYKGELLQITSNKLSVEEASWVGQLSGSGNMWLASRTWIYPLFRRHLSALPSAFIRRWWSAYIFPDTKLMPIIFQHIPGPSKLVFYHIKGASRQSPEP